MAEVHSYEPSQGTTNLGHLYEQKLAALFALRLCNLKQSFNLLINARNFDRWDDIVIITEEGGLKKLFCLQVKHVTGSSNAVLRADMFEQTKSKSKTICDLKKMYHGFQQIKHFLASSENENALFQNVDSNNIHVVLFTNIKGKLVIEESQNDEYVRLFQTPEEEEVEAVLNINDFRKEGSEEEWKEFCSRFLFFGNQVGQSQLNELINAEICNYLSLPEDLIPTDISAQFLDFIKLWSGGRLEGYHTLTENHIRNVLTEFLLSSLDILMPPDECLVHSDQRGHEEWNRLTTGKSLIVLQHSDDDVEGFLFGNISLEENTFASSDITEFLQNRPTSGKCVIEALKSKGFDVRHYICKDSESSLYSSIDTAILMWKLRLIPLIIVIENAEDIQIAQKVLDITQEESPRIILLLEGNQYEFPNRNVQTSFVTLADIEDQYLDVLQDKLVRVNGHEFTLNELFALCPTNRRLLTSENVLQILIGNNVVGDDFEIKPHCIKRRVLTIGLYTDVLNIKSEFFVICGEKARARSLGYIPALPISGYVEYATDNELKELDRCRILLIPTDNGALYNIVYEKVCSLITNTTVHLIKLHLSTDVVSLQWLRTSGSINVIKDYRIYSESLPKTHMKTISGDVNILSGDPGYGKTIIMNQLALELKGFLTIFITLANDAQTILDIEEDYIGILRHFLALKTNDKQLYLNIFQSFLEERKVLIIFDGMDEISRAHKEGILNFIKLLTNLKIKIWITSRVNMQEELESRIDALAYKLHPFNEEEQKKFLRKNKYTNEKIRDFLNNKQDLHDIPLYLYMSCKSPIPSNDVFDLCENFLQQEINKCCSQKGLKREDANYFSERLQEFIENYALYIIFPEEVIKGTINKYNLNKDLSYYIETDYTNFGLIRKSNNQEKYVFIHKTICDYLAAKALIQMKNEENKRNILKHTFDEKLTALRHIFHKLKINGETDKELKTAIMNKNDDQVNTILENVKDYTEDVEERYTTSLHLAAQWGIRHYYANCNDQTIYERYCYRANEVGTENIVELLLRKRKLKRLTYQKDCLLSWNPIQYADHSESIGILEEFAKTDTFHLNNSELLAKMSKNVLLYFCIKYRYNNIFDLLCENEKIDWSLRCADSGNSFLHCACRYGNAYVLDVLLQKLSTDILNKKSETPLHVAAYGCKNMVLCLTTNQSKPSPLDPKDSEGYTPLHRAVKRDQIEIVELLISKGADINTRSLSGSSLAHTAAYGNQIQLLNVLIACGATVNETNNGENLPLHTAIEWKSEDCFTTLIEQTTNIDKPNKLGRTPLDLAIKTDQMDLVKTLTSRGAKMTLDITTEISAPIRNYLEPILRNQFARKYINRSEATDSGGDFGFNMVALLSLQFCGSDAEEVYLSTNAEECGVFEDIIVHKILAHGKSTSYLIQLKQQQYPQAITPSEFENDDGNYSLKKYVGDINKLTDILNDPETKKSNVIRSLKSSDDIIFILFTNRSLSKDHAFGVLEKNREMKHCLDVINTGGFIHKIILPKEFQDANEKHIYLFTNQVNHENIHDFLMNTLSHLISPLDIPTERLGKILKDYLTFIGKWARGELGGQHFLSKTCVSSFLTDVLFKPYMILNKANEVNPDYISKSAQTISNAMTGINSVTIIDADGNTNLHVSQEILHLLKTHFTSLPDVTSWTECFSNEDQAHFYKSNREAKSDLVMMVGYTGKITLLDVYKCTWTAGKLPLVLEVTCLQDYQNIMIIDRLRQEKIKLVLLNYTGKNLPPAKYNNVLSNAIKRVMTLYR